MDSVLLSSRQVLRNMTHYFCDELILLYVKTAKIGECLCLLKESFYEPHDRLSLGKIAATPPSPTPTQPIPVHTPACPARVSINHRMPGKFSQRAWWNAHGENTVSSSERMVTK